MWRIARRPLGVIALAVIVLLDAVISFVAAYTTIASDGVEWIPALLSVLVGLLMVIKAYGLWSYKRAAWLSVQILAALGAAVDAFELVRGHAQPASWFSFAGHLIVLIYSNLPSIRALYVQHGEPAP
jgi:uncharacterized membrane protein (DUF2068 family)